MVAGAEPEQSATLLRVRRDPLFLISALSPVILGFVLVLACVMQLPLWAERLQLSSGLAAAIASSGAYGFAFVVLSLVLTLAATLATLWYGRADAAADRGCWVGQAASREHRLERVAVSPDGSLALRISGAWFAVDELRWRILSSRTLEWQGALIGEDRGCARWSLRVSASRFCEADWKQLMRVGVARLLRASR